MGSYPPEDQLLKPTGRDASGRFTGSGGSNAERRAENLRREGEAMGAKAEDPTMKRGAPISPGPKPNAAERPTPKLRVAGIY